MIGSEFGGAMDARNFSGCGGVIPGLPRLYAVLVSQFGQFGVTEVGNYRSMKYYIYKDSQNKWRWTLYAANNEALAVAPVGLGSSINGSIGNVPY